MAAPTQSTLLAAAVLTLSIGPSPLRTFRPESAIGAGVDGHEQGEVLRMLSPSNARAMLSAGLKPVAYRLRTELAIEAWHWSPRGSWSDPSNRRGYWTSDDRASAPVLLSYGYRLPRRGSTTDQANNDGYSRLDDGDEATFWKSNPYLDRYFTGEDNARHPQWVVVDLERRERVGTVRIVWGEPRPAHYEVQYAPGNLYPEHFNEAASWRALPPGKNVAARFVRVLMTGDSVRPPSSSDPRDRLGYAIREIYLGPVNRSGKFHDILRHSADRHQTRTYASSTDPWHTEADLDPRIEQPGFDLIRQRGLTAGSPMLVPAGVLYDTPGNAAAELRFLRSRGFNVLQVELGEEPEEQYCAPEDYGALYIQFADALHRVDPCLQVGGPSLVANAGEESDAAHPSFMRRFVTYLNARGRLCEFGFFSFEWYPFDDVCASPPRRLASASGLLENTVRFFEREQVPREIPWIISEYGWSAYGARAEVDLEGALFNAGVLGTFLSLSGSQTYLYGYEPNQLLHDRHCTWGNNMLFGLDAGAGIAYKTAAYWAARALTGQWASPAGGPHQLYAASSGAPLVPAHVVRRPDGLWSALLLNLDPGRSAAIRLPAPPFTGMLEISQFSRAQYIWRADGAHGHPRRSEPPEHRIAQAGAVVNLPPYSLTVIRTAIP